MSPCIVERLSEQTDGHLAWDGIKAWIRHILICWCVLSQGGWWAALLLVCTTIMAICATVAVAVVSLRPILAVSTAPICMSFCMPALRTSCPDINKHRVKPSRPAKASGCKLIMLLAAHPKIRHSLPDSADY